MVHPSAQSLIYLPCFNTSSRTRCRTALTAYAELYNVTTLLCQPPGEQATPMSPELLKQVVSVLIVLKTKQMDLTSNFWQGEEGELFPPMSNPEDVIIFQTADDTNGRWSGLDDALAAENAAFWRTGAGRRWLHHGCEKCRKRLIAAGATVLLDAAVADGIAFGCRVCMEPDCMEPLVSGRTAQGHQPRFCQLHKPKEHICAIREPPCMAACQASTQVMRR